MQQIRQSEYLRILSHAPGDQVKQIAERVLPYLGDVLALRDDTGLVMLPAADSPRSVGFHLGKILTAQAHVRLGSGVEGYGACIGRDLERAMALALLDAALVSGIMTEAIEAFISGQRVLQRRNDETLLRQIQTPV